MLKQIPVYPVPQPSNLELALLVDGENLSNSQAPAVLAHARTFGELCICAVYGDLTLIAGWEKDPEFRLVHSGSGKNSADMMLCIEAVDLAFTRAVDGFVIATSDQDFTHLAQYLTRRGYPVFGVGEKKTAQRFRKACRQFVELGRLDDLDALDRIIRELLNKEGDGDAMPITSLNARMRARHGVKISENPEKTWRAYFEKRSDIYRCDPKGPDAKVHLVSSRATKRQ